MNSLQVLAEEATFGVCVSVRVSVCMCDFLLSYLYPTEVILPTTIHGDTMSVHVILAHYNRSIKKVLVTINGMLHQFLHQTNKPETFSLS